MEQEKIMGLKETVNRAYEGVEKCDPYIALANFEIGFKEVEKLIKKHESEPYVGDRAIVTKEWLKQAWELGEIRKSLFEALGRFAKRCKCREG